MTNSRARLSLFAFLALIPTLAWIPTRFAPADGIASAAAVQGFANPVAYRALLVWMAAVVLAAMMIGRQVAVGTHADKPGGVGIADTSPRYGPAPWLTALGMMLAFFPWALARTGPFGEDALMLAVLHRMDSGQVPYVDFEFLYGPLLIYPTYWWQQVTGFSMLSYYQAYAVMQAAALAGLVALTIRMVGRTNGRHWWALLLIAPFFLDTLAGINWFGVRRLLPLVLLLWVAASDSRWHRHVVAGLGAGFMLAYSHDYAAAALLAMATLYAFEAARFRSVWPLLHGALTGSLAVGTWYAITGLILGTDGRAVYLQSSRELVSRFSLGEAGFRFYWTLSALALFGLLTIAIVRIGAALPRYRQGAYGCGDRLLLLGMIYAVVLLKAGLNRADTYHLTPPFLGLVLVVVLIPPAGLFAFGPRELVFGRWLVGLAAMTCLVANLPTGSHLARGLISGTVSLIGSRRPGPFPLVQSRAPALVNEQVDPDPQLVALARFLARPAVADVPAYFYAATYSLPPLIGVVKQHYINDDFMYSIKRGIGEWTYIEQHPAALVVITAGQWGRLQGGGGSPTDEYAEYLRPTVTKSLVSMLSSVHYRGVPDELTLREARWRATVGRHLIGRYAELERFGDHVVLAPVRGAAPP